MKHNYSKEEIKKHLEKFSEESKVACDLLSRTNIKVNKLTIESYDNTHKYTFNAVGKSGCYRYNDKSKDLRMKNLMWIEGWIDDTLRSTKAIMISNINNGNYEAVIVY